MTDIKREPIWSPCESCKSSTIQDVLFSKTSAGYKSFEVETHYMLVMCCGCRSISFRKELTNYEQDETDEDGEWILRTSITTYPKLIEGHHELSGKWFVPKTVRKIYEQSLLAIREDAGILAGLGLRGTIEAVCNDLNITGSSLEKRISTLSSQGLISKKDAERLHAIRFLGNDAAHDIKEPAQSQLSVALKIVEHLLNTVYILERETKGELDTIVSDFRDFLKIIDICLMNKFSVGDEVSLAELTKSQHRRVKESIQLFEIELVKEIGSGSYPKLELGPVSQVGTPPKLTQKFKIKETLIW